jgi:hypothetical protein
MDKPRHPLVIQPWKTQQSKPSPRNVQAVKAGKEPRPRDTRASRIPTSKKTRDL